MNKKQSMIPYVQQEGEIWKRIEYCKGYEISNLGRVKIGEYIIVPSERYGYLTVRLNKTGNKNKSSFLVHRLVADAFIPNQKHKPEVDHIDTNKSNNNVNNLRWCWHLENMIGNKNTLAKLTPGFKKKVIYESIRQDLFYSKNSGSKIVYDDDLDDIVFNSIGKTISELLATLQPSYFGRKTLNKLHESSETKKNFNNGPINCILHISYNDLHTGMKFSMGKNKGEIVAIDLDTNTIKVKINNQLHLFNLGDTTLSIKLSKI